LVVDFVGNSGRHKLITSADILGGKLSDEVIELAERRAKQRGCPVNMADELNQAQEDIRREIEERKMREAARKAHLIATADFSTRSIDPFDILQMQPVRERGWDAKKQLSEKQRALLLKQGVDPSGMPYAQARQLIDEIFRRWNGKLCTLKQAKILRDRGIDIRNLSMEDATKKITEIAKRERWRAA